MELSDVLIRAGDRTSAERELRRGWTRPPAATASSRSRGRRRCGGCCCGWGSSSEQGGRLSEALMLRAARAAVRAAGGQPGGAQQGAAAFWGWIHRALGEPQVAARYHQAALEEARLAGDRRATAELLIVMAHAVQAAGAQGGVAGQRAGAAGGGEPPVAADRLGRGGAAGGAADRGDDAGPALAAAQAAQERVRLSWSYSPAPSAQTRPLRQSFLLSSSSLTSVPRPSVCCK